MKLNLFPAAGQNMKRLSGLPLSRKVRYLLKSVFGEIVRARAFGTLGLRLFEISLTDRCQCRCKHCFAAQEVNQESLREELTTEEVKSLIDEIDDIGGIEVCFSGGEPLLRKDLPELICYAHKKGLVTRLITNGLLLDREMVKQLKKTGLNWCSISLDSAKAEIHDEFRGYEGCFRAGINGLKILVENGIPCSIITVARKDLVHSNGLEEIVRLGHDLGVNVVRINFPVPIGRILNQDDQVLSYDERNKVRELLRYKIVSMEAPRERSKCTAAVTKINVLPNGNVTPCVFIPLVIGSIRKMKLIQIWKDMSNFIREYHYRGQCPICDPEIRPKLLDAAEKQRAHLSQRSI
jgi:MoaA/NifB/PqqE/SkfB family radical SAM enzyme